MDPPLPIPVLILAGGRAERLGGIDKAFLEYRGQPLIARAIEVAAQVGTPMIASSRSAERYRALGWTPLTDALPDFAGPLSGLLAGFQRCRSGLMLSLPVDLIGPQPAHLRQLAAAALASGRNHYALLDGVRQPLMSAWQVNQALIDDAAERLARGQRAVHALQDATAAQPLDFGHQAARWINLNLPMDSS